MKAIVYTSHTGHTTRYARLLGQSLALPVYSLQEARRALPKGEEVFYLGWLMAGFVKGYKKAARRWRVQALGAVGLCDTGTALEQVRRTNKLPPRLPLFTLQGGMDKTKLTGLYASMIKTLTKMTAQKKDPSPDDRRLLYLLENDADYVSPDNLKAVLSWWAEHQSCADA